MGVGSRRHPEETENAEATERPRRTRAVRGASPWIFGFDDEGGAARVFVFAGVLDLVTAGATHWDEREEVTATRAGAPAARTVDVSDEPAVTIHSYSVPLKRMGIYSTQADGQLCRRAVPWDETLEPD